MNGNGQLLSPHDWVTMLAQWRGRPGDKLLALDFDGTLSPLVERPDLAVLPDRERAALARLAGQSACHVVLISGRSLDDLKTVVGMSGIGYGGSHGMEIEWAGERLPVHRGGVADEAIATLTARLQQEFAGQPGILLEPKSCSVCVHYRQAPDHTRAEIEVRRRLTGLLREFPGFTLQGGKMVWEMRPIGGWRKGDAVRWLATWLHIPEPDILIMGDDLTDEYAFQSLPGALTIKVGDGTTAAHWRLEKREEVAGLLEMLAMPIEDA